MRILFLCTGNSCRSQMAEGFARHYGAVADSAGIEAHGLNANAVASMNEVGIDISSQQSKVIDGAMLDRIDLVITVCDHAKEHCPIVQPGIQQLHWSIEDPAQFVGTPNDTRAVFRRVRDEIGTRVQETLTKLVL